MFTAASFVYYVWRFWIAHGSHLGALGGPTLSAGKSARPTVSRRVGVFAWEVHQKNPETVSRSLSARFVFRLRYFNFWALPFQNPTDQVGLSLKPNAFSRCAHQPHANQNRTENERRSKLKSIFLQPYTPHPVVFHRYFIVFHSYFTIFHCMSLVSHRYFICIS